MVLSKVKGRHRAPKPFFSPPTFQEKGVVLRQRTQHGISGTQPRPKDFSFFSSLSASGTSAVQALDTEGSGRKVDEDGIRGIKEN